ncbi:MAG: hypothetical protein BWY38_03077 [Ignavibacteria bacterium ADurb.Bin266]|nr:MAG: hypothetical protein BWY38_03077 [Ignavibacteria bacterium ADurb.Bin266]
MFKDFHKASSAEINTGTEDNKYVTPKGITDSILRKKQTSEASSATPTPTGNYYENEYYLTALATDAEFAAPSGTLSNGNTLLIRIKDNGTARALTWNAVYRGIGLTLPATTTISKTMYVGGIYNSADSKWDIVSVITEK